MKILHGKVAIVTGSSRGIGAEVALMLANAGAKVVVNYVQNQSAADKACAAISDAGGEYLAVRADVSDPAAVRQLFDLTIERFNAVIFLSIMQVS